MSRAASRLRAACGVVGPVAFTAAWALSGRRQHDYSIRDEHISGLAAPDARDPQVMTAGFLTLGACTMVFARELWVRLAADRRPGPGPALFGVAGAAVISAGLLRRDMMSNHPPEGMEHYRQSWRNDGHDVSSFLGHTATNLGLLMLARRLWDDPRWPGWGQAALGTAGVSLALGTYFAGETTRPGNGIVQRVEISVQLAFMAAMALRMLRRG